MWGDRLHVKASSGIVRALTALLLLAPETPMLFMGQEFAASTHFCFSRISPMRSSASKCMKDGNNFLAQFPSVASPEAQAAVPDPCDPALFQRSKLDLSERRRHAEWYALHQRLLRLRREDPIIGKQARRASRRRVIGLQAFVMRYFGEDEDDRLLIVNLGADLRYMPAPEPLLAPSPRGPWEFVWSSDAPRYGGPGIVEPLSEKGWFVAGGSAAFYATKRG